jgi:hypothetical protein
MNADEMLDFFLGFTTLDIKGDDHRDAQRMVIPAQPQTAK